MTFTEAARRLAGQVTRSFGWTPGEFWAATPAELVAILSDPAMPLAPPSRADIQRLMEQDADG